MVTSSGGFDLFLSFCCLLIQPSTCMLYCTTSRVRLLFSLGIPGWIIFSIEATSDWALTSLCVSSDSGARSLGVGLLFFFTISWFWISAASSASASVLRWFNVWVSYSISLWMCQILFNCGRVCHPGFLDNFDSLLYMISCLELFSWISGICLLSLKVGDEASDT